MTRWMESLDFPSLPRSHQISSFELVYVSNLREKSSRDIRHRKLTSTFLSMKHFINIAEKFQGYSSQTTSTRTRSSSSWEPAAAGNPNSLSTSPHAFRRDHQLGQISSLQRSWHPITTNPTACFEVYILNIDSPPTLSYTSFPIPLGLGRSVSYISLHSLLSPTIF